MARYIVLSEVALGARDWERLGCSEFNAAGYEVVGVDLRRALGISEQVAASFKPMNSTVGVASLPSLEQLIATISESDVVLAFADLSIHTRPLFRLLGRYNIHYVSVCLGMLPLDRLRSARAAISVREYLELLGEDIRSILYRWRKFLRQVCKNRFEYLRFGRPWIWLTAGTAVGVVTSNLPFAWRARRVAVGSFDCITFAKMKRERAGERRFCVFVDEAFCDHPDFEIIGVRCPVSAEEYWPSLERFFQALETQHGLKVVIAPHPKSGRIEHPSIAARVCAASSTAELIRDSDLVLCHASTAVSFAVLFRKPLLFLTTDQIENSNYRGAIARMSSCFSLRRVNANSFDENSLMIVPPNEDRYRLYEKLFLRAPQAIGGSPWSWLRQEAEAGARVRL